MSSDGVYFEVINLCSLRLWGTWKVYKGLGLGCCKCLIHQAFKLSITAACWWCNVLFAVCKL